MDGAEERVESIDEGSEGRMDEAEGSGVRKGSGGRRGSGARKGVMGWRVVILRDAKAAAEAVRNSVGVEAEFKDVVYEFSRQGRDPRGKGGWDRSDPSVERRAGRLDQEEKASAFDQATMRAFRDEDQAYFVPYDPSQAIQRIPSRLHVAFPLLSQWLFQPRLVLLSSTHLLPPAITDTNVSSQSAEDVLG
jgi:hypothetical protein